MITVSITKEQRKELEQFRISASSKNSEKALMVLLSSEGKKVSQIAREHPRFLTGIESTQGIVLLKSV